MIKSSVILIAGLLVCRILRQRSAAERHIVCVAAIAAAAFLPLLTSILPAWQIINPVGAFYERPGRSQTAPAVGGNVVFHAESLEPAVEAVTRAAWLFWLGGVAVCGVALLSGFIRRRSLASRAEAISDPVVGSRVRLMQSVDRCMPMTWGILHPRILLPNCFDTWTENRKRVVLAHELAHVHRLDWLFQTCAQIACALYWFNPLFWIVANRLYRESEQACDDAVINLGIDARDYASHLLEIARTVNWTPTLAMARPSTLEKRFAALLNPASDRRAATSRTLLLATVASLLVAAPLAALDTLPAMPGVADINTAPVVSRYTTPPLYSDAARSRGIEGVVSVEARIGIDGAVKRLRVIKGLGYGLDENALLAVRDWRFLPAMRETTTQIDVEFSLRNAEINELIANDMATRLGPGVVAPQVVHRVEPANTRAGGVILDAVIPEDGVPRVVRVIQSVDWERAELAINALRQWRFSPAMKDGRAVKVRMNIAINF